MKNGKMIMATLLVFAMVASVVPLYDASAPAIGVNGQDTNILIKNVTATPSSVNQGGAVNITCDVTANGTTNITSVKIIITDPANNVATYNMTSNTTDTQKSGKYWYNSTYSIAGKYEFTINVTDESGNWNTATGNFTVNDTTPPTISNVKVTPSSVVEGNPVNITAAVTDNVGVNSVKLTVKKATTVNNTTSYEIVINNTAMSEYNGTYYYKHIYGVGSYVFEIYADDAAGNSVVDNSSTNAFNVTEDTAAPVIGNVAANPSSTAQGGWVNITASVTDAGVGVQKVCVNITYPNGTSYKMNMNEYNGTYYYNSTYAILGTYTYVIIAKDNNNNTATSDAQTFEITDGMPPVITEVKYNVDNLIVTITANITDNVGVNSVTVSIFNSTGGAVVDNATMDGNNGTYSYTSDALALGDYSFVIYASDAAGNMAKSPVTSFSIVDKVPPVISNITVSPSNIVEGNEVTISCIVTDNVAVASVKITLDGTEYNMTLSDGHYTYTISNVTFGKHTFTITATDEAGNNITSEKQTFSAADKEKPSASPSSNNPTKATLGSKITITYTVTDDDNIQSVVLHYVVDNGTEKTVVMKANGTVYTAEISLPDNGKQLTYWVVVTDSQGSTTTSAKQTISLEKKQTGLSTALLAGIGILILIIIIAAAMMMKKKGSAETETEEAEETGESEDTEESEEESSEETEEAEEEEPEEEEL